MSNRNQRGGRRNGTNTNRVTSHNKGRQRTDAESDTVLSSKSDGSKGSKAETDCKVQMSSLVESSSDKRNNANVVLNDQRHTFDTRKKTYPKSEWRSRQAELRNAKPWSPNPSGDCTNTSETNYAPPSVWTGKVIPALAATSEQSNWSNLVPKSENEENEMLKTALEMSEEENKILGWDSDRNVSNSPAVMEVTQGQLPGAQMSKQSDFPALPESSGHAENVSIKSTHAENVSIKSTHAENVSIKSTHTQPKSLRSETTEAWMLTGARPKRLSSSGGIGRGKERRTSSKGGFQDTTTIGAFLDSPEKKNHSAYEESEDDKTDCDSSESRPQSKVPNGAPPENEPASVCSKMQSLQISKSAPMQNVSPPEETKCEPALSPFKDTEPLQPDEPPTQKVDSVQRAPDVAESELDQDALPPPSSSVSESESDLPLGFTSPTVVQDSVASPNEQPELEAADEPTTSDNEKDQTIRELQQELEKYKQLEKMMILPQPNPNLVYPPPPPPQGYQPVVYPGFIPVPQLFPYMPPYPVLRPVSPNSLNAIEMAGNAAGSPSPDFRYSQSPGLILVHPEAMSGMIPPAQMQGSYVSYDGAADVSDSDACVEDSAAKSFTLSPSAQPFIPEGHFQYLQGNANYTPQGYTQEVLDQRESNNEVETSRPYYQNAQFQRRGSRRIVRNVINYPPVQQHHHHQQQPLFQQSNQNMEVFNPFNHPHHQFQPNMHALPRHPRIMPTYPNARTEFDANRNYNRRRGGHGNRYGNE